MIHFDQLTGVLAALEPVQLARLKQFVVETEGILWVCGNGGSAASALHWACDLSKAARIRAQALGANPSVLTAWSNDDSYASALARELARLARPGDRLICLSCSGTSSNIVTVLRQSWMMRMPRALLVGAKWKLSVTPVDVVVSVQSADYGVIEDAHMAIGHWLTRELSN